MRMFISPATRAKLAKPDHNVTDLEIIQCFANRDRKFLTDTRPEHQTPIPTQWFVSETDYGRKLKIVFILDTKSGIIDIKSAYSATAEVERIYTKHADLLT
ncbi:ADP-ribosyl-(dinitrogen reductase) hydrolase [Acidovorax sp. Leaf73]|uniref:ADP-ribosyl-(dinitrogen reductase) hydrolase n=1 Tax=Acidovorax sp. Leaf73 TaxID=2876566 RepID=UPI001E5E39AA|nr:ADP-ribosyl-(dinitrogen reductase) hydrolase [Acidovorax sp. Leaf73]